MTARQTRLPERGTPQDLIDSTRLGARLATRACRVRGLDDRQTRAVVLSRYRLCNDLVDDYGYETLMAAAQRAVDEVIEETRGYFGLRDAI